MWEQVFHRDGRLSASPCGPVVCRNSRGAEDLVRQGTPPILIGREQR